MTEAVTITVRETLTIDRGGSVEVVQVGVRGQKGDKGDTGIQGPQGQSGVLVVADVDNEMPGYVLKAPFGLDAWSIVRLDGKRASMAANPSYLTPETAWAARKTLVYT